MKLPNGDSFMYTIGHPRTASGTSLEGRGVKPDFAVELNPDLLLEGEDSQLARAVSLLKKLRL
jgi:C-terminal processing protease CtpA/Prc